MTSMNQGPRPKLGPDGKPKKRMPPHSVGPINLLVLQPTPFCNLDCAYCYLPSRTNKAKMPMETAEKAIIRTMESGLVSKKLSIVWHAGEPLVMPRDWYREADALVQKHCAGVEVTHNFQSNAVLVNDDWCDLFKSMKTRMGVSIDGPEHIHDAHRKTRAGKGTHKSVMKGVECLNRNDVPFHIISVVTKEFLHDYEAALDFFESLTGAGLTSVGFNVEEFEGNHEDTSMDNDTGTRHLFREFLRDCHKRHAAGRLNIREVREYDKFIKQGGVRPRLMKTQQNAPFRIITVGHDGGFSTFSPELHDMAMADGEKFVFGNVHENAILDAFANPMFVRYMSDIIDGYSACSKSCAFFDVCAGGSPGNKFFELGTMAGTETLFCDYRVKETVTILRDAMGLDPIVDDHPALIPATPAVMAELAKIQ
ncbi:MAG: GRRM system radical SAM/SPASM domain protein [Alphaproteobacteria bacterium]|jgi:uncharacterized protein|nr:GRRM system radical SAM/SPASM domain protein [Rhodospirillaceae bacterium]MBT7648538.1 GRRM system radical SAM/SPASM domain protein [Rhodospirillaceae bacterium]MDG2482901.1 GRRM system radical SAM/SPASM domain protein [Alphaproteobacteria bacterium]